MSDSFRPSLVGLLGGMTGALGVATLIPLGLALALSEPEWPAFAVPATLGIAAGWLTRGLRRPHRRRWDGGSVIPSPGAASRAYGFVVLAWVLAAAFGSLPYIGVLGPDFLVNALFESASGFSTTGASIFPEVETLPRSLLLWRALTQWLGAMGIVILFVWMLGRHAFGLEVLSAEPGPTPEKTRPKLTETARDTVIVGAALTLILFAVLLALDVGPLDAVCHALTTLATGGFSTRNDSLAAFSPAVQWVVIGFMVLGGVRFSIHVHRAKRIGRGLAALGRRLRREPQVEMPPVATYGRDPEIRLYLGIIVTATVVLFGSRFSAGIETWDALRHAAFQAVTMITGTGYANDDYDQWSDFARCCLLLLMFSGGCAGSTTGSIKVLRWLILCRKAPLALRTVNQPHTEIRVHVGRAPIPDKVAATIGEFILLVFGVVAAGALALVAMGVEPITAFSASAASVLNVGPGLAGVGPAANYAFLPSGAKLMLSALMIAGRLEIITVAVLLFAPLRQAWSRLRALR